MSKLTFDELRSANVARCNTVFHTNGGIEEWSVTDWACAMGGEAGEALNVAKKMRRLQTGTQACRPDERDASDLAGKMADELADVLLYADLLAARVGIDLGEAVARKFNVVSLRVGSDITLPEEG